MKKNVLLILIPILFIISCDSTTKPETDLKIYGTLVDAGGNPISGAEVCIIPYVPYGASGIISGKDDLVPEKIQVVELNTFKAELLDAFIEIKWSTLSELNSDRFELQRAVMKDYKPGIYENIATVKAKGNSSVTQFYSVSDSNLTDNTQYIYKLKIIDKDETSNESNFVQIFNDKIPVRFYVNYPNPFYSKTTIPFYLGKSGEVNMIISGKSSGIEYYNVSQYTKIGEHKFTWEPEINSETDNSTLLRPGIYTIKLTTSDSTATSDILLDFRFKESDCKIPPFVTKTDNNGKFLIDWTWFPEIEEFYKSAESGAILAKFNYGKTAEIISRKLNSQTENTKKYLIGRQTINVEKDKTLHIKLTAKEVVVQK